MALIGELKHYILGFAMVVMALALLLSLFRAMAGPRFTDRIVAINMIGTQAILMICILSYMIGEQYLVDVAIVYAMISFLAVVALVHIYLSMLHERVDELRKAQDFERREHDIELGKRSGMYDTEKTDSPDGDFSDPEKKADTSLPSDVTADAPAAKTSDVEEKIVTADTPAAREIMEATAGEDESTAMSDEGAGQPANPEDEEGGQAADPEDEEDGQAADPDDEEGGAQADSDEEDNGTQADSDEEFFDAEDTSDPLEPGDTLLGRGNRRGNV